MPTEQARKKRQRQTGLAFIVIALLMVAQGVWLSFKQDREGSCQADYNAQVVAVQKQRAEWADEDRHALNQMIFELVDPKAKDTDREQAVQQYISIAQKNDQNRKANPLPARTSCSYGWL